MPAFNIGTHVRKTVDSIINQSYQNWELIIVNDGSNDNTQQILDSLHDSRIKVYHQSNQGQCAARNIAFSLSKGQLIKFMDADDMLSPDYLEAQEKVLHDTQEAIAYSDWARFYNGATDKAILSPDLIKGDMHPFEWLKESMTCREVMLQCALWLIPRNLLLQSGLWNEQLSLIDDFEFSIRVLLQAKQLKYTPNVLLYYRSGQAGSVSGTVSEAAAQSAYQSLDMGTRYLLHFSNTPDVKAIAADCFQRYVYNFYPQHSRLVSQAESKIKQLGGSSVPFPAGGYTKTAVWLLGWKMVKRIKKLLKI